MEIKKIISLCKKNGCLVLYENDGEQWLSDGFALFPLTNLPHFDHESICRTYDIPEKKAAKMIIRHEEAIPDRISVACDIEGEMPCEFDEDLFQRLVPVQTTRGLVFIQKQYLSPFSDAPADMLYLFERHGPAGNLYFAVKVGFVLMGIIPPIDHVNEDFVNRIRRVCEQCEVALANKKEGRK